MTTPNLPPGLPPLPPVPEGFDRWEYRGMHWGSPDHCTHAVYYCDDEPWEVFRRCVRSGIYGESHYLEAVREPAEQSAQLFATLDPENGKEVSACPECVQGYVQETGFDRCDKCNPAASGVCGWRPIECAAQDLLSAAQLVRSVVLVSFQQGQHPRTTMDFGRFQTAIENLEAVLSPPAERSDYE